MIFEHVCHGHFTVLYLLHKPVGLSHLPEFQFVPYHLNSTQLSGEPPINPTCVNQIGCHLFGTLGATSTVVPDRHYCGANWRTCGWDLPFNFVKRPLSPAQRAAFLRNLPIVSKCGVTRQSAPGCFRLSLSSLSGGWGRNQFINYWVMNLDFFSGNRVPQGAKWIPHFWLVNERK